MDDALIRKWSHSKKLSEQVAAFMARGIANGQIRRYQQLPDNTAMADEFGVSVSTVLRAKRLLAENGAAEKEGRVYVRA